MSEPAGVMKDWAEIVAKLIGIVALTIHDYVRYRINLRERARFAPPQLRRLRPVERRARYRAKWKRLLPYTGATRRL